MVSKYYIPHIDEFHIGFEYEIFQKGDTTDEKWLSLMPIETEDKWYKATYPDPYLGYRLDKMKDHYQMRTKYLDADDIISLGFDLFAEGKGVKVFRTLINEKHEPELVELTLIYEGDFPIISILQSMKPVVIDMTCLNKSELKWLLQRLRII